MDGFTIADAYQEINHDDLAWYDEDSGASDSYVDAVAQRLTTPNVREEVVVKCVTLPGGQVEVVGYPVKVFRDINVMPMPKAKRGESLNEDKNRERAVQRARKRVRLLCKQIMADRLLTLTYRENVQDRERVESDFKEFSRLMNRLVKRTGKDKWRYVAVLERQERGAWHIHLAVHGRQVYDVVRALWHQVVGVGMGNIDVQNPKGNHAGKVKEWPRHKLAAYISKYIGKDAEDSELNAKRYWASRGIDIALPVSGQFASLDDALRFAFGWICDNANLQGISSYVSHGRGCFWLATADQWYERPIDG
ncbi:hypothetical protein RN01_16710 [Cupriavidus sp. SHE]|uniref:rolling circle replication-associated protein n=1 Tax=Cupriavidus TaxID=106589 RepID=UPI000690B248|nr:hypothetical protein [Cupriavidus sp. SHE]KWR81186.1 hypothetical protein RN01_16710 [Cupriavidus sp. SHE]